jgi:predicted Zn-dependent protease
MERLKRDIVLAVLGALLLGAGDISSAAPEVRSATSPSVPPRGRAYFLFSLSQQAQFQRNYVDALKYLQEAVRFDDSADLRVELADLYVSLNQSSEAEEQARKALAEDPGNVRARQLLADTLAGGSAEDEGHAARLQEAEKIYRDLLREGNADDDSVMALADIEMDRGDVAQARSTLESYRASKPASSVVDMELARIDGLDGRLDDAISLLQGVVSRDKRNREARNALGDALESAGRLEEAEKVFEDLVNQAPNNPYNNYRLAGTLLSLQKYREAQDHLITALKADSGNTRVLIALGQAYEGTHQLTLAEQAYEQVLKRDPESMEARFYLARIHQSRGEDDAALDLYAEVLSRNSDRRSAHEKALYSAAATQVGIIRLLQKNYTAALHSLGEAYQASEKPSAGLFALMGRADIGAGQNDAAQKILAEGEKNYPDDAELAATQGEILLRDSKPEEAKSRFQDLLARSRNSEEAFLEVAQACMRTDHLQDGERWLQQGLEKHPESRDLRFQSAALDEQMGHFRQSEKQFRELIRQEPDDAEALNYLGYMLADRGTKLQEALGMLEKAVKLEPENIAYLDSLGWVHFKLGRYQEAEEYLLRASRGSRLDPTIFEHLGDVRAALGKKSEALEAYRSALDHGSDKPEELRNKIRKLGVDPETP